MISVSWTVFKSFCDQRSLSVQWFEANGNYYLKALDSNFSVDCVLNKTLNSDETLDFETNYKAGGNVKPVQTMIMTDGLGNMVNQLDTDNALIVRPKAAKKGWTFCASGAEFSTSSFGSLVSKLFDGSDHPGISLKLYNANDVEITSSINQGTCTKTIFDFEPPYDYEIIGGAVRHNPTINTDVRVWIVAVPDVPYASGGTREMASNINLKYLSPGNELQVDGRVSKFLTYSATYHTNKLRFILKHGAGDTQNIHLVIEHYKA